MGLGNFRPDRRRRTGAKVGDVGPTASQRSRLGHLARLASAGGEDYLAQLREYKRNSALKYEQSDAGKETRREYRHSEPGKEAQRKYRQTDARKESQLVYEQSDAGKETQRREYRRSDAYKEARHEQSDAGIEARRKYRQSDAYKAFQEDYRRKLRQAAYEERMECLKKEGRLDQTVSPELLKDMVTAAWEVTKWAPLGPPARTLKEFTEVKHGSVYVGITCRSLLEEFLRWLIQTGVNIGASAPEQSRQTGLQQGKGSSRVAGGQVEEHQRGEGRVEVGVEEDSEDAVLPDSEDDEVPAAAEAGSSEDDEVAAAAEVGSSSKKPKIEAPLEAMPCKLTSGNRSVLQLVLDELDNNGHKKLRPIKLRDAMRLGFEGFWIGHFHHQWDAESMEAALQTKLVSVQEYVYFPGSDSLQPKLYVVYRLRVIH